MTFGASCGWSGSAAQGNDLTDTARRRWKKDTLLVSKYWNVATPSSPPIHHHASLPMEFAADYFSRRVDGLSHLQMRALRLRRRFCCCFAYVAAGFYAFVEFRYWLPLVFSHWRNAGRALEASSRIAWFLRNGTAGAPIRFSQNRFPGLHE